jgi:tetrahydromethanopterin S-methyltransferase subunit C
MVVSGLDVSAVLGAKVSLVVVVVVVVVVGRVAKKIIRYKTMSYLRTHINIPMGSMFFPYQRREAQVILHWNSVGTII